MPRARDRADQAARALGALWLGCATAIEGGFARQRPGIVAAYLGVPIPAFNGVWVTGREAAASDVEELLEELASTGAPHRLQVRPDADPLIAEVAGRRGMRVAGTVPLMVLDDAGSVPAPPEGLDLRRLEPSEVGVHVALAAPAFGMPEAAFARAMRSVVHMEGTAGYLGSVGGEVVATGCGFGHGGSVGVFNVAIAPAHRRRGHGAAVTAHVVREAAGRGAGWAWLQSSPDGYGVYRRLGFRDAGAWSVLVGD